DTFFVTYKYREKTPSLFLEEKTVSCTKTIANIDYNHEFSYKLYGNRETVSEIKTTYFKYDKRKNLLEYGEIDNQETYLDYMQNYPEEYHPGYYVPFFVKALLEGKTNPNKKVLVKQTFDAKNNLLTKSE